VRLLISAEGGGSNGYRVRLWKVELQNLADELKLPIMVCHLPPGTSKWNKMNIVSGVAEIHMAEGSRRAANIGTRSKPTRTVLFDQLRARSC